MTNDRFSSPFRAAFDGRTPVFLTEDEALCHWLNAEGTTALLFDDLQRDRTTAPPDVVAIALDWNGLPTRQALREMLLGSRVMWLPLASFSSDFETATHAMEMVTQFDLVQTVARNRRVATRLLLAKSGIALTGPETALHVRLPDTLQVLGRTRLGLLADEHTSIGSYFEVALSPTDMAGTIDAEMSISGTVRVDSLIVGKHREMTADRLWMHALATEVGKDMRAACPFVLTIEDNRIVQGLERWAEPLSQVSGPHHEVLTEVAVGTGGLPPASVDWSRNCLLNEGACGVHVGIGNTVSSVHIDFISTEGYLDDR